MDFRFLPLVAVVIAAATLVAANAACAEEASLNALNTASPAASSKAKAWQEAMQALKAAGYTQGVLMPSAEQAGAWIGSARDKDGKRVDVAVDNKGNVTQQ
jgi:spermidine/putrescine-binding protein